MVHVWVFQNRDELGDMELFCEPQGLLPVMVNGMVQIFESPLVTLNPHSPTNHTGGPRNGIVGKVFLSQVFRSLS